MKYSNVDELLSASRPEPSMRSDFVIDTLIAEARTKAGARPKRSWKRLSIVLPTIGLIAAGTTAGAIAFNAGFDADAVIPINYTLANGDHISCTWAIAGGALDGDQDQTKLKDFIRTHDWSGLGPEIYNEAIAHPYVPTAEEEGEFSQAQLDRFSFGLAANTILSEQIDPQLTSFGASTGSVTDCTGELR